MSERRREKRYEDDIKVTLESIREGEDITGGKDINALTCDISPGGARILTHKFYPFDASLRIQINLVDAKQLIEVEGKVKWIKKMDDEDIFEIGVEFLHHISKTVLVLLEHIYGNNLKIPTSVS
jgi:c-di-GMP-binding flagellar brake protein YcgR